MPSGETAEAAADRALGLKGANTFVTIEDSQMMNDPTALCGSSNTNGTVDVAKSLEDMKLLYRERYQLEFLDIFTRSITRNDITLYMNPGLPLILHYPVGDTSYIRFVVMMCEKDDDDESGGGGGSSESSAECADDNDDGGGDTDIVL